jgi:hypothetical protein
MRTFAPAQSRSPKLVSLARPGTVNRQAAGILHLQRTIGNQAVQRMLQREVPGPPGPPFARSAPEDARAATHLGAPPGASVPAVAVNIVRSPGVPLDLDTRASFEQSFGHDFSGVRVHTDARAAPQRARASTAGRNRSTRIAASLKTVEASSSSVGMDCGRVKWSTERSFYSAPPNWTNSQPTQRSRR